LVLGSTQPDVKPPAAAGLDVVRRRSGGGAVLVRPGSLLWVDVIVPSSDRLWRDDVGRAFAWLGETWLHALSGVGVGGARRHDGALVRTAWSDAVCFAGLGPGEVTVDGRKVVGLSQRRTREAALFQCAALLAWDPSELETVFGIPSGALAAVANGLPVAAAALEDAFLSSVATF
jgi:lipoate-protein ligase A